MSKAVLTRNIDSLLQEYASSTFTPLGSCDFNLLGVVTYIKRPNSESYTKIPDELYEQYSLNINSVIIDKININQVYKVEIFKALECTIKLEYRVNFDEFKTHPKLVILPTSHIPYKTMKPVEIYKLLINEVNKIKVKNRILINFHNNEMLEDLKKFVRHLYAGNFLKPVMILLFEGIEPELSVQSHLSLVFKNKNSASHQIVEVEKDEIILEYRKPVYGCNGFNCYGKQIEHGELQANSFDLKIDEESIEVSEYESMLTLKSKKRGFVDYHDNYISVSNVVKVENINRIQSKITDAEKNDIEVYIAQEDITKDSVGEGVELISERIHVSGHTGANSILKATELVIDGATHKDSVVYAKNALINRHKGTLRCHRANIKLLEGGKIHATYAEIGTCLGGSIFAKDVVIDHVKNHLIVYASNSITIRLISGEDNNFIIDYSKIPVLTSEMSLIAADIDELKFQLEEEIKRNGNNVQNIETNIKELRAKKDLIKNSSLNASITIKNPLNGLNIIKFVLPNNEEIVYKTLPKKYEEFHLQVFEDKVTLQPVGISKQL
jgi:hypothetical protein